MKEYRGQYADLEAAFGDDWEAYVNHYLTYGLQEGRDGGGEFDAASYANRYEDLKAAFGYDLPSLYQHYLEYGINENRLGISQAEMNRQVTTVTSTQVSRPSVPSTPVEPDEPDVPDEPSVPSEPDVEDEINVREEKYFYDNGGWYIRRYENDLFVKVSSYDSNGVLLNYTTMEYENNL